MTAALSSPVRAEIPRPGFRIDDLSTGFSGPDRLAANAGAEDTLDAAARLKRAKRLLKRCESRLGRAGHHRTCPTGMSGLDEVLGGESDANLIITGMYEKLGAEVDVWAEEPKRNNVVATIKGTGGGRSLIFNGHIDTVPTGRHEDWKFQNPFSGQIDDNNIYGRGACDMKAGIVAQAMAATAMQRCGVRLKGDLILESVVGEEVMDHEAGTSATVRRGYRADAAIVSEPSASGTRPLAIVPVSPGLLWMAVTCLGKASHASNRGETIRAGGPGAQVGVNAIDKGNFILSCLLKLEQEWGLTK
ncbi:MAG: M20/M25/M40 family metallo-hydrolase, partial [Planctomycetes bacterium]|nr:M20/M25/M40 family metallo-hydrolase [Planctomycetota bacterium]